MQHEQFIRALIGKARKGDRISARERNNLEYKESFNLKNTPKYAKTMAAFSNNRGGYIIFGIRDKPREIIGVNKNFNDFPQEKFTEVINTLFSPEIFWDSGVVEFQNFSLGYFYIQESDNKPVMALKNDNSANIQNGEIYYRYRGRSEKIKYSELTLLINSKVKKERERIIKLMQTIENSDTTNLGIVDYSNGKLSTPYGTNIEIDKRLIVKVLKKAKFIKEGSFSETDGIPVIRVTGNIDIAEEVPVPDIEPSIHYPYLQKQLAKKLGIQTKIIYALVWYYGMKGDKKFHMGVSTASTGEINLHKFSEAAFVFLSKEIDKHKSDKKWLDSIYDEFVRDKNKYPDGKRNRKR